jgi:hypothetical protein
MSMTVLVSWVPWIVAAVAAPLWYLLLFGREGLGRMLSRVSTHWFPIGLIVLVYVMAAGQLGASLGIPALFRDDPAAGFNRNSRAFWGAFAATWLIGQVWLMIYVHLYIARPAALERTARPKGWDPLPLWILPSVEVREFQDWRSPIQFLAACTPPFLLVLLLVGAFPADVPGGPAWTWRRAGIGLLEYGGGILAGMLAVALVIRAAWGLARRLGRAGGFRRLIARTGGALRSGSVETVIPNGSTPELAAAGAGAFWSFLTATLIAVLPPLVAGFIVPSLAISLLLGLIVAFYFVLVSLRQSLQVPFVLLLLGYITWSNSGAYKYRFPHMGGPGGASYYDAANLVPGGTTASPTPPPRPLLDDTAVLDAWRRRTGEPRPKLVILAVTGGAYRAGFWTAAVLDALQDRSAPGGTLPGLTDRIRIITGASGGMVGASYFAAMRAESGAPGRVMDALAADAGRRGCAPSPYPSSPDSLTPIVQQLVQRDIPMIFCPIDYQRVDRGVVLDRQWCTLERPVSSLRDGEAAGWRPSLIVSPMIIETGERLLISNLDLSAIAQPESVTRTPYLRSARQMFRMFPGAQATFRLSTAVRMNATFPYASPAVSLPTAPPLRVVDAGYYDNYGVNLAAAWAYQNRDWLRAYTSGVALIQVYAYPLVQPGAAPAGGGVSPGEAGSDTIGQAFQWFTSPLQGALAARNLSMLYRNEEQLAVLDDTLNTPGERPAFFERFAFAYPGGAAMNWFLTEENLRDMRDSIAGVAGARGATPANREQLDRLVAWWNGRVPRAERASPLAAPFQAPPQPVPTPVPQPQPVPGRAAP